MIKLALRQPSLEPSNMAVVQMLIIWNRILYKWISLKDNKLKWVLLIDSNIYKAIGIQIIKMDYWIRICPAWREYHLIMFQRLPNFLFITKNRIRNLIYLHTMMIKCWLSPVYLLQRLENRRKGANLQWEVLKISINSKARTMENIELINTK